MECWAVAAARDQLGRVLDRAVPADRFQAIRAWSRSTHLNRNRWSENHSNQSRSILRNCRWSHWNLIHWSHSMRSNGWTHLIRSKHWMRYLQQIAGRALTPSDDPVLLREAVKRYNGGHQYVFQNGTFVKSPSGPNTNYVDQVEAAGIQAGFLP